MKGQTKLADSVLLITFSGQSLLSSLCLMHRNWNLKDCFLQMIVIKIMMRMMMTNKPTTGAMTVSLDPAFLDPVSSDPVSSNPVSSGSSAFLNNGSGR